MTTLNFNEQNQDLINSDGYRNYNNLLSSQEFLFFYNDSKFLWKELMKINAKYIERSRDLSSLEPYVENILYSRLLFDDIDMLSNEYILQLVTLLQLTGQYLVYSQKKLEAENQELEERLNEFEDNFKSNEKYQLLIDNLNRQNQEKDFLIKTYQNMIKGGYGKEINKNMIETDINLKSKKDGNDLKKDYYYCKYCANKKFKSQQYLDEHMKRRHYYALDSDREYQETRETIIKEKNNKKEFEDKLNSMREYFEKIIKQTQENSDFNLLYKRIDDLSNKMLSQNANGKYNNEQYGMGKKNHSNYGGPSQKNLHQINNNKLLDLQMKFDDLTNYFHNEKSEIDEQLKQLKNEGDKDKKITNKIIIKQKRDKNSEENITIKKETTTETTIITDKETNIKQKSKENIIIKPKNLNKEIGNEEKKDINDNNYSKNYDSNNPNVSNNEKHNKEDLNESKKENTIVQSSKLQDINKSINESMHKNKNDEEENKNLDKKDNEEDTKKNEKTIVIEEKKEDINKEDINKEVNNDNDNEENKIEDSNINIHIDNENEKDKEKNKSNQKYKESQNMDSPKFSYNPNQESKIQEIGEKKPETDVNEFYRQFKKRDDNYNGYVDDYYKIKIPVQANEEEVNIRVNELLGDPNYVKFEVDKKINDYEQKLNTDSKNKYVKNIYDALDLQKIIEDYKNYCSKNNIKSQMTNRENTFSTANKINNTNTNKESANNEITINASRNQPMNNQSIYNQTINNQTMINPKNNTTAPWQDSVSLIGQNMFGLNNNQ